MKNKKGNMESLIKRILTAALLLPPVLFVIIKASSLWFFIATIFIVVLLCNEWSGLFKYSSILKTCFLSLNLTLGLIVYFFFSNLSAFYNGLLIIDFILWTLMIFVVIYYNNYVSIFNAKLIQMHSCSLALGLIMLVSFWLSTVYIREYQHTYWFLICLLFMVWSIDTGAYFFGKFFGKHKLIKNVSPGKTVEGAFGGLLSICLLNAWFYHSFSMFHEHISVSGWILITLVIYIFAVFGDLVESMFKRIMVVKDSGTLLPGHGGILDRLDSLISTTPIYYLLLNYFYL